MLENGQAKAKLPYEMSVKWAIEAELYSKKWFWWAEKVEKRIWKAFKMQWAAHL